MSDTDLEKNLVHKQECYICLDICTTPSPCLCQTFVHKQCLQQYLDMQEKTQCNVCLSPLPTIQHRFSFRKQLAPYITVNVIAMCLQINYPWIDVPIVIVTISVSTVICVCIELLKYRYINQCLVYKGQIVHK